MNRTPAGWYRDPWSNNRLRYWNGEEWTLRTSRSPVAADDAQAWWTTCGLLLVAVAFFALVVQPLVP